ncbi:unnamed protein product [Microthlaspi erraticum]|uniref:Uncharacterized protein n=1 Tax=Microthlaspi erraticum TaxID=1685480 RepID=A0A6D2L0Z8_9BRAS|nr:unnamed protein product [Microthlaspi erraticum]CAA7053777.1 unnamed protein product [Microthlaspi erraticum]
MELSPTLNYRSKKPLNKVKREAPDGYRGATPTARKRAEKPPVVTEDSPTQIAIALQHPPMGTKQERQRMSHHSGTPEITPLLPLTRNQKKESRLLG